MPSGALDDPGSLRGLLHLAAACEVIADAALQIAEIALREVDMPAVYAEALDEAEEVLTSVEIQRGSDLVGVPLDDLVASQRTGIVAMALRRGEEWTYDPVPDTVLEPGDVLYGRGPLEGEELLRERAGG